MVLLIPAGIEFSLSLGNKVFHEIIMNKCNKYKRQREKDQQAIKYSVKIFKKILHDNLTDENDFESLCNVSNRDVDGIKTGKLQEK